MKSMLKMQRVAPQIKSIQETSVAARETSTEENPRNQDRHEPSWLSVGWQSSGRGFGSAQATENPSEWKEFSARGHNARIDSG
jgi:hypothetical protein